MKIEISTAEFLTILMAMETAATEYESEANRTSLPDIRRTLVKRAKQTRAISQNVKNRARKSDSDFASIIECITA